MDITQYGPSKLSDEYFRDMGDYNKFESWAVIGSGSVIYTLGYRDDGLMDFYIDPCIQHRYLHDRLDDNALYGVIWQEGLNDTTFGSMLLSKHPRRSILHDD